MLASARTLFCLAFAATAAFGIDKQFADQLVESTQNLERDAQSVHLSLKKKSFDAQAVSAKIEAMSADVGKLQDIVKQFDATNPSLSTNDAAHWKLVKDRVHLIEIFHEQKKSLASSDLAKNRTAIRDIAKGLVARAKKLQDSVLILRRG